jgi:hypothetical protein
MKTPPLARQRGAAAVEFALVSLVFFTMLFGAFEMGRLMFYWNTAAEVTRLGARMAVVCDPNTASRDAIRARMRQLLPLIRDGEHRSDHADPDRHPIRSAVGADADVHDDAVPREHAKHFRRRCQSRVPVMTTRTVP